MILTDVCQSTIQSLYIYTNVTSFDLWICRSISESIWYNIWFNQSLGVLVCDYSVYLTVYQSLCMFITQPFDCWMVQSLSVSLPVSQSIADSVCLIVILWVSAFFLLGLWFIHCVCQSAIHSLCLLFSLWRSKCVCHLVCGPVSVFVTKSGICNCIKFCLTLLQHYSLVSVPWAAPYLHLNECIEQCLVLYHAGSMPRAQQYKLHFPRIPVQLTLRSVHLDAVPVLQK